MVWTGAGLGRVGIDLFKAAWIGHSGSEPKRDVALGHRPPRTLVNKDNDMSRSPVYHGQLRCAGRSGPEFS